ncbi:MAG: T9SS type A sorting domain-containing protein [Tannerella sp.]|jgi:hypothetical protein|nr:T9SS type A sorting domain-containing protein [Tannerella sp.]
MKNLLQIILWQALFLPAFHTPASAQELYGMAATGEGNTPITVAGDFALKPDGKLYLQTGTLFLKGGYTGESGSEIHIPLKGNALNPQIFLDIDGTASGMTEIIPGSPNSWNGSRIELARARRENSAVGAFWMRDVEMDGYLLQLKHETRDSVLVWYMEKTEIAPCLPLIVQLGRHTLLANNNSATNGGHKFTYYYWYGDGQLLREGSHAANGGSYYTGGADLNKTAEYTVKAVDSAGTEYISCPCHFVPPMETVRISAYPNPVPRNARVHVQIETPDKALLQNAVVEIYGAQGQYSGKANLNGQMLATVDLPDKPGIYLLKFKAGNYSQTIKLIAE